VRGGLRAPFLQSNALVRRIQSNHDVGPWSLVLSWMTLVIPSIAYSCQTAARGPRRFESDGRPHCVLVISCLTSDSSHEESDRHSPVLSFIVKCSLNLKSDSRTTGEATKVAATPAVASHESEVGRVDFSSKSATTVTGGGNGHGLMPTVHRPGSIHPHLHPTKEASE
jgi:hypothetical protein